MESIVVRPLTGQVAFRAVSATDSEERCAEALERGAPVVFFQAVPPRGAIENPGARVVWIPMWDQAKDYPQGWWDELPKWIRIVAFSDAVAARACAAGLPVLHLRYFEDPATHDPASWDGGRVALYWNRSGLVGPRFLRRLCDTLDIELLLFRSATDPGTPAEATYALPERLGDTEVRELMGFMPREKYLEMARPANVFLAPRMCEGVGMTFLEALARGCAVFAYDGPTMNEYITHGEDGFLLKTRRRRSMPMRVVRRQLRRLRRIRGRFEHPVSDDQDWPALSALDLAGLGGEARKRHEAGYEEWQRGIPEYARFILDW